MSGCLFGKRCRESTTVMMKTLSRFDAEKKSEIEQQVTAECLIDGIERRQYIQTYRMIRFLVIFYLLFIVFRATLSLVARYFNVIIFGAFLGPRRQ